MPTGTPVESRMSGNGHVRFGGAGRGNLRRETVAWRPVPTLLREFSSSQAEDLYELICERYRSGSMIVTSNRRPREWYSLFPNAVLAESALDRLVNSAHHVVFRGRTYRPLRRPDGGPFETETDELGAESPPTGPSHQTRATETTQEPRNDALEGPSISADVVKQRSRGGRRTVRS